MSQIQFFINLLRCSHAARGLKVGTSQTARFLHFVQEERTVHVNIWNKGGEVGKVWERKGGRNLQTVRTRVGNLQTVPAVPAPASALRLQRLAAAGRVSPGIGVRSCPGNCAAGSGRAATRCFAALWAPWGPGLASTPSSGGGCCRVTSSL